MKINKWKKYRVSSVKVLLLSAVLLFAIITQTGCGNKEPVSRTDFCLNTTCTITIYDMDEEEAGEILQGAFDNIRDYENMMSRTVEGSDIYKINHAKGQPVEVSDETAEVIALGIYMGEVSDGMFDITIGEVTELWNFSGDSPSVPADADIKEALSSVDYRSVSLDGNTVVMNDPDAHLYLGGIAKVYIADRTGDFLEEKGVESGIVNLGGNVVTIGSKDDGTPWNIGIERPYSDRTEMAGSVGAEDETIVTSGIYERKFEEDGTVYHHIIDPQTGYPKDTDLESVTIKADKGNSAICDGFSTICLMYGREKALEFIERMQEEHSDIGLEAAFIDKNDDMVQTEGMNLKIAED